MVFDKYIKGKAFNMTELIKGFILFIQNSYGVFAKPYETYREIVKSAHPAQIFPLFVFIGLYFFFAGVVRHGLHPYIVAKSGITISMVTLTTYALVVLSIYSVGRLLKGEGKLSGVAIAWGYSLWPTLIWFYMTSTLYFLIPPPRTPSLAGQLFSYAFVVASLILFLWKGILYYLTLRFALKLDLQRIIIASIIIFPAGIGYALLMYKLNIFRIPFI
ncbi:hypothetical protein COW99_05675 [Candidatus Roizmanbacteria bacterium CG22_combo_CG10-13_8_21_14_all_38_20]|uniref:Yip1 domain-containing protein n=1 Tax=Candidatus Roizmanbacteria bacterium CG22_combo_CG10-13_8_21_14_all_38_20 TaxID=1974862 RepID=A0A2H0BUG2_9BACT|nr:MAG: hypothetical protein COW99_05675 [Candidatus Roizmanbacteria bacterium CG22_combo_CG10-13_8_21_14_all_38_20]